MIGTKIRTIVREVLAYGMVNTPAVNYTALYRAKVAGLQYHDLPSIYHHIHEGSRVWLEPEDNNPHDAKAVRIRFKNFIIGYVPKEDAERVRRLICRGKNLAQIIQVSKRKYEPTHGLEIVIPY